VLGKELRQTLFAQPRGALRGRVTVEVGRGDRRIDLGQDCGGAGPHALEQGAELIGERHALGDEIVAPADERAQGPGVAQRVLGWRWQFTLEQGLAETIAWYRDYLGNHGR
jgi:nucleoside-diphosphate-sugar epimerase